MLDDLCPCGTDERYDLCCGRLHRRSSEGRTAAELMRSRYAAYAVDVRREYAHVTDTDFAAGRGAILADLLARPALFRTGRARERWEDAARENVAAELARLRSGRTG